jgi:hypothetical protein
MFRATGCFITRSQIRWLYDDECQLHRTEVEMDGSTPAGTLLQFLKTSKDINDCVLGDVFDHSSCQSVVVNETVVDHSQEAETIVLKDHGFNELSSFTQEHQNAYQLDLQDNIYVGMAWVYSGDLYVFWHQCNRQHYDEFNNCSQEGSNAAMKSHAAAVLPGHSIASAGQCLHFQAQLKYAKLKKN